MTEVNDTASKWAPTIPAETYAALQQEYPGVLRLPRVVALCGVQKSTIWKWAKIGKFPAPVRLSANATGWREADVRAWVHGLQTVSEEGAA